MSVHPLKIGESARGEASRQAGRQSVVIRHLSQDVYVSIHVRICVCMYVYVCMYVCMYA